MEIKTANIPKSEYSEEFLQGMVYRLGMAFVTYGPMAAAYPDKVKALDSMMLRVKRYQQTGNKEFLIDAANFLLIEFKHPSIPDTYFRSTDARESPGRIWHDKKFPSTKANSEEP